MWGQVITDDELSFILIVLFFLLDWFDFKSIPFIDIFKIQRKSGVITTYVLNYAKRFQLSIINQPVSHILFLRFFLFPWNNVDNGDNDGNDNSNNDNNNNNRLDFVLILEEKRKSH